MWAPLSAEAELVTAVIELSMREVVELNKGHSG